MNADSCEGAEVEGHRGDRDMAVALERVSGTPAMLQAAANQYLDPARNLQVRIIPRPAPG